MADPAAAGVLAGTLVLDFGRYVAGPYCAALLGDLGADVIRIERPQGAEDRAMTPLCDDAGAMYLAANRNKRSLALDPKTPDGQALMRRLLERCDVVVANLPPAALAHLGIDWPSLSALNPRAILTTVSAFGEGPLQERPGFDGLGQAMSGAAYLTGDGSVPLRAGVSWVDYASATMAAFGTLAALLRRQLTGQGEHVRASLMHTALAFGHPALIEQAVLGNDRAPMLNRGHLAAPADIYPTRDGWVMVYAVGDAMFARWAEMIGEKEAWLGDPRFANDASRGSHGALVSERMRRWTLERTTQEVLGEAARWRLPAGPVYSPRQVLADEPLLQACRARALSYPGIGPYPDIPLPLASASAATTVRPPPALGEHTEELRAAFRDPRP